MSTAEKPKPQQKPDSPRGPLLASLSMYDWPQTHAQSDLLWAAIAQRLRAAGLDAPDALTRDKAPDAMWPSPDLVLGQTCGLPYVRGLRGRVALVGTPDYQVPDCDPGWYNSVIVVRSDELCENLSDFQNRRLAINGIHDLMKNVILQMEEEIGKNRVIQTHGKIPYTEERKEKKGGHTMPASRRSFQQAHQTGGMTAGNYWIHRLAQMQSIYRVCSTAREPAISKHQSGLPFFMDKSEEFARLMEWNISDVQGMLPGADEDEDENQDKGKYQARKSKDE